MSRQPSSTGDGGKQEPKCVSCFGAGYDYYVPSKPCPACGDASGVAAGEGGRQQRLPRCEYDGSDSYWGGCEGRARFRIERPGEGYSPAEACEAHVANMMAWMLDGDEVPTDHTFTSMSQPARRRYPMDDRELSERDSRAYIVASLLQQGHSAQAVSRALEVIDGGGSPEQAMAAMRESPSQGPIV